MRILAATFLLLGSQALGADLASDTAAARAILDANGWQAVKVTDVAETRGGRIVSLNLRGETFGDLDSTVSTPARGARRYIYISELPEAVGKLTALERLDLNGHQLLALPASVGRLRKLKQLHLNPDGLTDNTRLEHYGTRKYPFARDLHKTYKASGRFKVTRHFRTGSCLTRLPASMAGLTDLEVLDVGGNRLGRLPAFIGRFSKLRKLNAEATGLTELPGSIKGLTGLEELRLDGNALTSVPEFIGELVKLRLLSLRRNRLATLPPSLGKLTGLTTRLDLAYNELAELPESIGTLTKLRHLKVDHNRLSRLPESIGRLAALRRLDANSNRLTALPASIGGLKSLAELHLEENALAALPAEIGGLARIKRMYLMYNRLAALPDSFGKLATLETLFIHFNALKTFPDSFGGLTALVQLEANNNKLTGVPASFAKLKSLRLCSLHDNELTRLPDRIGERLHDLRLSNNRLVALPPGLNAFRIFARNNRLAALPDGLMKPGLGVLDVTHNRLKTLPDSIGKSGLRALKAGFNELTALPDSITGLTRLRIIVVPHNRIAALPAGLGGLTSLWALDVRHNRLTALPESIGRLKRFQMLYADSNRLERLPDAIMQARPLVYLYLNHNRLTLAGLPKDITSRKGLFRAAYNRITGAPKKLDYWLRGRTRNYAATQTDATGAGRPRRAPRPQTRPAGPPRAITPALIKKVATQEPRTISDKMWKALIADFAPRIGKLDAENATVKKYLPRLREKLLCAYVGYNNRDRYSARLYHYYAAIRLRANLEFYVPKLERGLDPAVYLPGAHLGGAFLHPRGVVASYQFTVPRTYDPKKPQPIIALCQVDPDPQMLSRSDYIVMWSIEYGASSGTRAFYADIAKDLHVDPFRTYLSSHSQGGDFAYELAWKYPHQVAALVTASCDLRTPLRYARFPNVKYITNVPTRITVGSNDGFKYDCKEIFQELAAAGGIVDWRSWRGDHGQIIFDRPELFTMFTDHFDKWVLYPYPRVVTHVVEGAPYTRAYWANARLNNHYGSGDTLAEVTFRVRADKAKNTIVIEHCDDRISGFDFHLNKHLVGDMTKPVHVIRRDGKTVHRGPVPEGGTLSVRLYDKTNIPPGLPALDRGAEYVTRGETTLMWEELREIQRKYFGHTSPVPSAARAAGPRTRP